MHRLIKAGSLGALLLLGACVSMPTGPGVMALPGTGKSAYVASPGLLDLVARSVDEMRLANLFCWAEAYASPRPALRPFWQNEPN